jgi:hypothetical protein
VRVTVLIKGHVTNLLLDMSHTAPDTTRSFEPSITQHDIKQKLPSALETYSPL